MGKNLLLIDDNQGELNFFEEALARAGIACHCTWVAGITRLVQLHAGMLPDIIFLDLNIPWLNSLECLRYLKSHQVLSAIPVITWSSGMNRELRKKCLAAGASACLAKSDPIYNLAAILEQFLLPAAGMAKISA